MTSPHRSQVARRWRHGAIGHRAAAVVQAELPTSFEWDDGKSGVHALCAECAANLVENCGVVDCCRHAPGLAIGDFLHGAAQDFARARLRQPRHGNRKLEGGNRPDLLADENNAFPLELADRALYADLEHDEAARYLALEPIGDADHGAFRHILVRTEHLFNGAGRETVAG